MTIKPMRVENMAKNKQNKTFSLKKDAGAWMLLIPSAFLTYLLTIRPQVLGIFWSFFDMKGFAIKDFVGFDNYRRVVTDTAFAQTFLNTWIYVFWSLVVGLALPFVIAIVMNELIRARKTVRVITYLPAIMPAVAVSMLWYYMYYPDASGLLNMLLAKFGREPYVWLQDSRFTILYIIISMTWSGAGGTALYYFAGLQGINRELYEAAMMDGAGFFRRIRVVTIPQMSGMLILFAMYRGVQHSRSAYADDRRRTEQRVNVARTFELSLCVRELQAAVHIGTRCYHAYNSVTVQRDILCSK